VIFVSRQRPHMLEILAIANYRSIRQLVIPLRPLIVVSGANGAGKSNLYRALRLLAETARGGVISAVAHEGGLGSTLWAGPDAPGTSRREGVSLRLGFTSDEFTYAIDLGFPEVGDSMFYLDPEIKRECIWAGRTQRPGALLIDRRNALVRARRNDGNWETLTSNLANFDSLFSQIADPVRAPEVLRLRDELRTWRFYDHLRTDMDAPVRREQIGTRTVRLAHDGHDLAAALQTIRENGDDLALREAISAAFPGTTLQIRAAGGRFTLELQQEGLLRPLNASELSDGTLRYLLWIAVLLTPRPPLLVVLNEPETSLHPDLVPALGQLIRTASRRTQIWVTCHSPRLIASLREDPLCSVIELEKNFGATEVRELGTLDQPAWKWPAR